MPNFKSPGPEGIPNFWLKQLDALHIHYVLAFNKLIQEEKVMDEWLTVDNTFLIPTSEDIQLPHKSRPITCLQQHTSDGNNQKNYVPPLNTRRRPTCRTERM